MTKDPNQGEGDRESARRYNKHLREFVHEGKVAPAADDAREYVEREPTEARRDEHEAGLGPTHHIFDPLVAKARAWFARLREAAHRARTRPGSH